MDKIGVNFNDAMLVYFLFEILRIINSKKTHATNLDKHHYLLCTLYTLRM